MLLTLLCCLAACQRAPQADTALNTSAPDAGGGPSGAALATLDAAERLDALGAITPAQTLRLSFHTGGLVRTITPQLGAPVTKGMLLAALDTTSLELDLAAAQAEVTIQQAQLELIQADPQASPAERIIAATQLRQAQIQVEQLQLQIANAAIYAPFDGQVAAIQVNPGEWASAGQPVFTLLDTHTWLVETKNISELNISRIRVGQSVQVHVIAFPEQSLTGAVAAIYPIAVVQQGDTTYTLLIRLAPTTLALLPGMNAEVAIKLSP